MDRDGFFRFGGAEPVPLKRDGAFSFFLGLELPEGETRDAFNVGGGKKFQGPDEAVCAGVIFDASPEVAADGVGLPGKPGQFAVHFNMIEEMARQINPCLSYHGFSLLITLFLWAIFFFFVPKKEFTCILISGLFAR